MNVFQRIFTGKLGGAGKNGAWKRIAVISVLGLIVVIVFAVTLLGPSGKAGEVMAAEAEIREFVSVVVEKGELRAARTATFSAPRLRRGGGQWRSGGRTLHCRLHRPQRYALHRAGGLCHLLFLCDGARTG